MSTDAGAAAAAAPARIERVSAESTYARSCLSSPGCGADFQGVPELGGAAEIGNGFIAEYIVGMHASPLPRWQQKNTFCR